MSTTVPSFFVGGLLSSSAMGNFISRLLLLIMVMIVSVCAINLSRVVEGGVRGFV